MMEFDVKLGYDPAWIMQAVDLYAATVLGAKDPIRFSQALANSYRVATVWDGGTLVGIGRMLSDGEYYAAIFDVAVLPVFQKLGVGRLIMEALHAEAPGVSFYLTSTFGNVPFYQKLGFKKHRTAMAKYPPHLANSPYLVHEEDC